MADIPPELKQFLQQCKDVEVKSWKQVLVTKTQTLSIPGRHYTVPVPKYQGLKPRRNKQCMTVADP